MTANDTVEAIVAEMRELARDAAIHHPGADDAMHDRLIQLASRLQSAHDAEVGALRAEIATQDGHLAMARALLKEGDIEADHAAYWHGWRMCAKWANRDDLLADRDSPAYARDRDKALAGDGNG